MKGIVKWFDPIKGYGFIMGEDKKDYFVHYTGIVGKGFRALEDEAEVTFDLTENDRGLIAVNVVSEEE